MGWLSSAWALLSGRSGLAAAGLPVRPGAPAELGSFDRVGGKGETITRHVCVRAFPAIVLYAVEGVEPFRLAWFSGACQGALALRARGGDGRRAATQPSLARLDPASLPPAFGAGLEALVELPRSERLFTSTAVAGVFLQLAPKDRPWEFAYQDGWARLAFPASQLRGKAGFKALLAAAELLDQALQTPEEAAPEGTVSAEP